MAKDDKMTAVNEIVSDLLNMAERIEHAAAEFYFEASKHVPDEQVSLELRRLASKELEHEDFFSDLKSSFENATDSRVQESTERAISRYVKAFQDSRVFDFDFILNHTFTGYETSAAVIQLAITLEKDSIVFYSGLANIVEDKALLGLLKEIIGEEFDHLSALTHIDFR